MEQRFYEWVPATAFAPFRGSKVGGGNTQRSVAMCPQMQGKGGLLATKRGHEQSNKKMALQFSMFLRPQGYTQNVLVRHTE